MTEKTALRKILREARLSLSPDLVAAYSKKISHTLLTLKSYQQAQHIGCYLPMQNEVDLHAFIKQAWQMQKQIYLPVLNNANDMDFYAYTASTELRKNKYGINEPNKNTSQKINPAQLDLLLIPLIAFDNQCNRLGQGVGFYDRYLAHYKHTHTKPMTIGLGYELQKVTHVPTDAWDIALDAFVSEAMVYALTL